MATINTATSAFIRNIEGCMSDMRSINSFMLMTVNRCIDFTKASRGLQLVPKIETVNFIRDVASTNLLYEKYATK